MTLTQDGALHEQDRHCQSAASAYDRRHGRAQARPAYATRPPLQLRAVLRLARAFAGHGDGRRGAPLPAAPRRERRQHLQPQPDRDRGALPVPGHAAPPRPGGRDLAHEGAAEAAAGAEPRGDQARPDHGDEPQGAGDAVGRIWLRAAGQRSDAAAGVRHRQRPDDHSRRAVERPQGPERDASARDPRPAAAMVEGAAETA